MKLACMALLALWASFALNPAWAQTAGYQISGQVVTPNGQAATGATINLLRASDSLSEHSTFADANGKFLFKSLLKGDYVLRITLIGFRTYTSRLISLGSGNSPLALPAILIQESATNLKEIAVTAGKPLIEEKIDRTILNVNAMISSTGSNALEVLEKAPGVQVDENGTISLKGKTGVLVMIDDKPTYLSASDLATFLKSLPASNLDKIELMDNPPARYDAAGNAGAINIKTKKLKNQGLNGSFSSSYRQSKFSRAYESLNLNYRSGKLNLFANASYSFQQSYRRLDLQRNYLDEPGQAASTFKQTSFYSPINNNTGLTLGADYDLSKKTTIGIVLSASFSPLHDHNQVYSSIYGSSGALDSSIYAVNSTDRKFNKRDINLNFTRHFTGAERTLNADFDYLNFSSNSVQSFINTISQPDSLSEYTQKITDNLPTTINIYAGKLDYSQILPNRAHFQGGLKSSFVNTDNAANYFNILNGMSSVDYSNTNRFLYKENINAAYVNYNEEFKRLSLQLGLRLENTNNTGNQLGNAQQADSSFRNTYVNLFPTVYLSFKLDTAGKNSLVLSYGRRIGRPYYQDLNPFVFIVDKFTYFSGNPFLKPQFSSNYQLSYRYAGLVNLSLNYEHSTDIQNETITQQGAIFVSRTGNIGTYDYYGLQVNLHFNPIKWWSLNAYGELSRNHYEGTLYATNISSGSGYLGGQIYNEFSLGKGWSAELSGDYSGPHSNAQFTRIGTGRLNAGLQKKVLHDQGTFRLSASDLFHTYSPSGTITNIPGATSSYHNTIDSDALSLGFSYNFGGEKSRQKRQTGALDNEAGRVKN